MASEDCVSVYNITEKRVSDWLLTQADAVIITIIIPIILGLGLINNSTFLFVIFRVPKMRSDTNIFLAHLALSDLLFLTTTAVVYVVGYSQTIVRYQKPFENSAACSIFYTVSNTGYYAAIFFVTLVSFERYLALCHPIKHLKIRGRRRTHRLIAICWLAGFLVSASVIPLYANLKTLCLHWPDHDKYRGFPSTVSYCGSIQPRVTLITSPLLNFPWIVVMVANIYMYARILQVLNKRMGADGRVDDDRKARQIRDQVAKMLIVNGIVFFLCHIPNRVISLSRWICKIAEIRNPLQAALGRTLWKWLPIIPQLINSAINSVIYGVMNSQYRQAFRSVFRCRTRQTNSTNSVPTASHKETIVVQVPDFDSKNNTDTRM